MVGMKLSRLLLKSAPLSVAPWLEKDRGQLTFGLFGRKKTQTQSNPGPEPTVLSRLQEITSNDPEMYQSMTRLLFLEPKRITESLEVAMSQETNFEYNGN